VDAWLASPTLKFDPEKRQWADLSPKQRVLNKSRVPDIVDSEDDYLCASITASYKTAPAFVPFGQNAIRIL
jgi:hypothetical protein